MSFAPPAENTWDLEVVTSGVLAVLRMENEDVDVERVAEAAHSATQLIDVELDMPPVDELEPAFDASAEPTLVQAAVKLAAELYLSPPAVDPTVAPDPVATVRADVRPWKMRWGIA